MPAPIALREHFLHHFLECEAALRGFIATVIGQASDREDVLQEIALRLWQLYDRYDAARPFTPWALGVAARRTKEECRKSARRPAPLDPAEVERMAVAFEEMSADESGDVHAALTECLTALPESSALLIRGRYFQRRGIEDLASSSGLTAAAVYQTLCRLRRKLADCIRQRLRREPVTPSRHVARS
jgi:RNA polymerase sigma-70 factor (ECF subfamily)